MKRLLAVSVLPLLLLIVVPTGVRADAAVVQDSCVTVPGVPPYNVWSYFSVVNFSLPEPVCALQLVPEPQPPTPGCVMASTVAPAGWSSTTNPDGGATWFSLVPAGCIAPGTSKGGFAFLLDPAFCCYMAKFYNAAGLLLLQQEECFTCQKVPTESKTWGHVKQIYE